MHNHEQGCEALHSPRLPPEQPSSTELLKERTLNEVEELDLSFFSLNDIAAHHDSDQLGSKMPTVPIKEFKHKPDPQGQLQMQDRNSATATNEVSKPHRVRTNRKKTTLRLDKTQDCAVS